MSHGGHKLRLRLGNLPFLKPADSSIWRARVGRGPPAGQPVRPGGARDSPGVRHRTLHSNLKFACGARRASLTLGFEFEGTTFFCKVLSCT
eukprot:1441328-Rhodomonas_salina.1